MHRCEDKVAGLGSLQGDVHCLQVAHLTDEDDVRRLPEHVTKGDVEVIGVNSDFALAEDGLLIRVNELNRILDRDYVNASVLIDQVDYGRKRGGLAGTGWPRHKNEPVPVSG